MRQTSVIFKLWQLFANTLHRNWWTIFILFSSFLTSFCFSFSFSMTSLIALAKCARTASQASIQLWRICIFGLLFFVLRLTRCRGPTNAYLIGTTTPISVSVSLHIFFFCFLRPVLVRFWVFRLIRSCPRLTMPSLSFIVSFLWKIAERYVTLCGVCLVRARISRLSCIWHWFEVWWKASWKRMADRPTIIKCSKSIIFVSVETSRECQMADGTHERQTVHIPTWTHFCIKGPRCWAHIIASGSVLQSRVSRNWIIVPVLVTLLKIERTFYSIVPATLHRGPPDAIPATNKRTTETATELPMQ